MGADPVRETPAEVMATVLHDCLCVRHKGVAPNVPHLNETALTNAAGYALSALRDAGFAVVRLPEPVCPAWTTRGTRLVPHGLVYPGGVIGVDAGAVVLDRPSAVYPPDEARKVGLSMVAAADHSRATSPAECSHATGCPHRCQHCGALPGDLDRCAGCATSPAESPEAGDRG